MTVSPVVSDDTKGTHCAAPAVGKVVAIEPLRWRNFEGEVTRIGKNFDPKTRNSLDFAIVEWFVVLEF